jgi:hypothetical protein
MAKNDNELIKIFGSQMKDSRVMCNLTQQEAAKLLGWGWDNSSCLAKVEKGTYTKAVDPKLAIRASRVYGVSLDYLYGETDDWERDPVIAQQKNIEGFIAKAMQHHLAAEINAIRMLSNKIVTLESSVNEMIPLANRCNEAFASFKQANPKFENMPKSSPLQFNIGRLLQKSHDVRRLLQKFHAETGAVMKSSRELLPLMELINI